MPVLSRGRSLLVLPILLGAASAACVDISAGEPRYIDTVEKRFNVSGTPSLNVHTFDGSVEVSTWDRPEVLVVVEKHAMDKAAADRMVVVAEQSGDRITVDVRQDREPGLHLNFGSHSARVTISAPARIQIDASTGDGRVEVRDVEGDITAKTGDGAIRLAHVSGSIDVASGDGSIEVEGTLRGLRARSGDGRVRVRAMGTGPGSDWSLTTGDGSIVLEVPDTFNAELDATTGDGRVSVSDLPFSGDSDSRRRSIARGRLGSGGPLIRMRSGDGAITVRRADASETTNH
jgi:hypothetical protein